MIQDARAAALKSAQQYLANGVAAPPQDENAYIESLPKPQGHNAGDVQRRAALLRASRIIDNGMDPDVRRGFSEGLAGIASTSNIPFAGVAFDAVKMIDLVNSSKRLEAGTGTDADLELLATRLEDESRGSTILGSAGSILGQMPTMGVEFLLSGGAASVVRKGASTAGKALIGKAAREAVEAAALNVTKKAVTSTATRLGVDLADAVTQSAVQSALVGRWIPQALEQTAPQLGLTPDDAGSLKLTFEATTQSFLDAIPAAYLDQVIEVLSEKSGGALGKGIQKLPVLNRVAAFQASMFKAYTKGNPKLAARAVGLLQRAGWNGMLNEMGEERVGAALRAATGLGDWADIVPSLDQALSEAVAFSVPGGTVAALSSAATPKQSVQPASSADAAQTTAEAAQPTQPREPGVTAQEAEELGAIDQATGNALREIRAALEERGYTPEMLSKATLVEPATDAQQAAARLVQETGNTLLFVDTGDPKSKFQGVSHNGVVVLDAAIADDALLSGLVAHELLHAYRDTAPDAALDIDVAMQKLAPELWSDSVKRARDTEGADASDALIQEEASSYFAEGLGGYLLETFKNPSRVRKMLAGDRGLVTKVLDALAKISNSIFGTKFKSSTQTKLEAFRDEVARMPQEKALPPRVALQITQMVSEMVDAMKAQAVEQGKLYKAPSKERVVERRKLYDGPAYEHDRPVEVRTEDFVQAIEAGRKAADEAERRKLYEGPPYEHDRPVEVRTEDFVQAIEAGRKASDEAEQAAAAAKQAEDTAKEKPAKKPKGKKNPKKGGPKLSERVDAVATVEESLRKQGAQPDYVSKATEPAERTLQAAIDQTRERVVISHAEQQAAADELIASFGGVEGFRAALNKMMATPNTTLDHAATLAAAEVDAASVRKALAARVDNGDYAEVQRLVAEAVRFRDAFDTVRSEQGRVLGAFSHESAQRKAAAPMPQALQDKLIVVEQKVNEIINEPAERAALDEWRTTTDATAKVEAEKKLAEEVGEEAATELVALEKERNEIYDQHNRTVNRRSARELLSELILSLPEDLKIRLTRHDTKLFEMGFNIPSRRTALIQWRVAKTDADKAAAQKHLVELVGQPTMLRLQNLEAQREEILDEHSRRVVRALAALQKIGIDAAAVTTSDLSDPVTSLLIGRTIHAAKSARTRKFTEYMLAGFVSAPKTFAVNIASNVVNSTFRQHFNRLSGAMLSEMAGAKPGDPSFAELGAFYDAFFASFALAGANAAQSWRTESSAYERNLDMLGVDLRGQSDNRFDQGSAAIGGDAGRLVRVPFRALQAADDFTKTLAGTAELAALAYRKARAEGLTGEAVKTRITQIMLDPAAPEQTEAWRRAKLLSFQSARTGHHNDLLSLMLRFRKHLDTQIPVGLKNGFLPIGTAIAPFVTTPYHVLGQGVGFPLHPINLMWKAAAGEYKGSRPQMFEDAGLGLVSLAITAAVVSLIAASPDDDPKLTGSSPRDAAKRALGEATAPAQSVGIGERRIGYQRLEPLATTTATVADAVNAYRETYQDENSAPGALAASFGRLFSSIMSQVQEDPMLHTIGVILTAASSEDLYGERAQALARSLVLDPLVPNAVRSLNRAESGVIEDRRLRQPLSREAIVTGATGFDPALPRVDPWGRAVPSSGRSFLERAVSPVPTARRSDEVLPVDRLIVRYNQRVARKELDEDASPYYPGTIPRYAIVRGERIDFTEDEYFALTTKAGADALKSVQKMRLDYHAPTEADIDKIKNALEDARSRARDSILRSRRK